MRSLPKGVYVSGKKFISKITYQGKVIHLGTFTTPEEASEAYISKQKELGVRSYKTTERPVKDTTIQEAFKYEDNVLTNIKTGFKYTECNTNTGYITCTLNGQQLMAHRVVWELHNGPIPENMVIDHINGIRNDNRIENLRIATRSQNNINYLADGGGAKGVSLRHNGKYQASIQKDGVKIHIGTFNSQEEASSAYIEKAKELYGEFVPYV